MRQFTLNCVHNSLLFLSQLLFSRFEIFLRCIYAVCLMTWDKAIFGVIPEQKNIYSFKRSVKCTFFSCCICSGTTGGYLLKSLKSLGWENEQKKIQPQIAFVNSYEVLKNNILWLNLVFTWMFPTWTVISEEDTGLVCRNQDAPQPHLWYWQSPCALVHKGWREIQISVKIDEIAKLGFILLYFYKLGKKYRLLFHIYLLHELQ